MNFEPLLSDNVNFEGGLASDVGSCCTRLAETAEVKALASQMTEDTAKELCLCLTGWLNQPYDRRYRHPKDMAFCAGFVLLKDHLKLAEVKGLLDILNNLNEPSLSWVVMVTEHLNPR